MQATQSSLPSGSAPTTWFGVRRSHGDPAFQER